MFCRPIAKLFVAAEKGILAVMAADSQRQGQFKMRYDCFVTPVWQFNLADSVDQAALIEAIHQARQEDPAGEKVSNLGGWQSGIYLHRREPFASLAALITQAAVAATAEWGLDFYGHAPEMNTMWATVNRGGDSNFRHHHWGFPFQNYNYLSGSYYVRCTAEHGAIKLLDERPSAKYAILDPFIRQHTPFTGDQLRIQPSPGDLVMFPAWLEHLVEPGSDPSERIGLAFNFNVPRALTDKVYLRDRE